MLTSLNKPYIWHISLSVYSDLNEWMNEWMNDSGTNEWMNLTKLKMLITRPVQLLLIIASLDFCNLFAVLC